MLVKLTPGVDSFATFRRLILVDIIRRWAGNSRSFESDSRNGWSEIKSFRHRFWVFGWQFGRKILVWRPRFKHRNASTKVMREHHIFVDVTSRCQLHLSLFRQDRRRSLFGLIQLCHRVVVQDKFVGHQGFHREGTARVVWAKTKLVFFF